jgi:hypothetical protein
MNHESLAVSHDPSSFTFAMDAAQTMDEPPDYESLYEHDDDHKLGNILPEDSTFALIFVFAAPTRDLSTSSLVFARGLGRQYWVNNILYILHLGKERLGSRCLDRVCWHGLELGHVVPDCVCAILIFGLAYSDFRLIEEGCGSIYVVFDIMR